MKLADFGISKMLKTDMDMDFTNTSVTNPSGSRGWMAPEVYKKERFDCKVDIFPLGCIFAYTLSGGKHPFGDDPDQRLLRIKNQQPMSMVQQDLKEPYRDLEDDEAFEALQLPP
jgi:serine/threonine-protein kinase/endoribonuclease IRE1